MAEVAANIESRTTFEDLRRLTEDKVAKADLNFYL